MSVKHVYSYVSLYILLYYIEELVVGILAYQKQVRPSNWKEV